MQDFKRWLYKDGRPNALARGLNSFWGMVHAWGIAPNYMVTLEVTGRRTGRTISFPLVLVVVDANRYLVAMLGNESSWVQNIRAADGYAVLRHGRTEQVRLEAVPVEQRSRILKVYLQRAPGARPHIPVDKDAPVAAFEAIAADYPVFQIQTVS